MKLLNAFACCLAVAGGNVKKATVMGEVLIEGLSDRSSILLSSTKLNTGRTREDRVYALATGFVLVSKIASKP